MNRLSIMRKQEIAHRVVELLNVYIAKLPFKNRAKKAFKSPFDFVNTLEVKMYHDFVKNCQWHGIESDKFSLLNNNYKVQSFEWSFEGHESWLKCPNTGFAWSSDFFHKINYREGGEHGDVRAIWEPSRLQQLTALAHIIDTDKYHSKKALDNYLLQFNSWFESNTPYYGPHYISVMECALRIISVCFASSLIKDKILVNDYWLKQSNLITSHAEIIFERLSLHSSSGNHTLTEAAGLIFAAKFYSKHPRAVKWLKIGKQLFVDEFIRQTNVDGSGIEQTSWYLKFIYELAIITLPLLEEKDKEFLQERVDVVNKFLSAISVNKKLLSYGDSDNGYAVSRYLNFIVPCSDNASEMLNYKDAGLVKIKQNKTVVFFDFGNLGMAPSYGHGHADCLSVILYYDGVCILGDIGTGTYNGDERLRKYFRSTAAHNTVVVNKESQSIQSSRFMWKSDVTGELIYSVTNKEGSYVLAKHYGYTERFNCTHFRGVFVSVDGELYVWDYIEGIPNSVESYWHLSPFVTLQGNKIIHENFELQFCELPNDFDCRKNNMEIPSGITSSVYGDINACTTVKTKPAPKVNEITFLGEQEPRASELMRIKSNFYKEMQKSLLR